MIRLAMPDLGLEELRGIEEVLQSGWLVQGARVEEFERLVAEYVGSSYAVAVSSGTAALHLALIASGVGPGDQVMVPAATFPATANVVEQVGARPVLVDIDPTTFNLDPQELARRCDQNRGSHPKAVMPVHLFGQSADMDPITCVARDRGAIIIEDAACALGAHYKGQQCGTLGKIGCFSFHPRKAITTGEGGMIVTNDPALAESARVWRNHGIVSHNGSYDFVAAGFNYRMTDIQGALGIAQIRKLEASIAKRKLLAAAYDELLEAVSWLTVPRCPTWPGHIYQSYVVLLDERLDRDRFIGKLKDHGVETTIGAYALHMLTYYRKKYEYHPDDFPNAKRLFETGVALPLHTGMGIADVENIADTIKTIGEGARGSK